MICKLCLEEKGKLVRAHVLSDFTLKPTYDEKNRFVVVEWSGKPEELGRSYLQQKQSPGAVEIDTELTSIECDTKKFNSWETYAARALTGDILKITRERMPSRNAKGYRFIENVEGIDYKKLKLFILSMLWRLSATTAPIGSDVNLGSTHEERIRRMLLEGDPGTDTDYLTWISKVWSKGEKAGLTLPFTTKIEGHHAVIIITGGYRFHVFISKHALTDPYLWLRMKEDGTAIFTEFDVTDFKWVKDMVMAVPEIP